MHSAPNHCLSLEGGGGIAKWLEFSDLNAEGPGLNPGVSKEI